ncbi:hypothetical protein VH570_17565 [Sphingobium sp. HT1-2]|uniref:hypothetical protein n=1 Tax=Sphingobium sp. HT1-2 TaxID=3111640 RepID=UPI003C10E518
MADNAIDKLMEEMRTAKKRIGDAKLEITDLDEKRSQAKRAHDRAIQQLALLQATLDKHIYEELPIVQAKMIAHEEIESQSGIRTSNAAWATQARTSATIAASSATNAAMNASNSALLAQAGNWIASKTSTASGA